MKLIDEGIASGLQKYSTIVLMLITALQATWATSLEMQALVSPELLNGITTGLAVLGTVARFIKQAQPIFEE